MTRLTGVESPTAPRPWRSSLAGDLARGPSARQDFRGFEAAARGRAAVQGPNRQATCAARVARAARAGQARGAQAAASAQPRVAAAPR